MEVDDLPWESSKTREMAVTFFNTELPDKSGVDFVTFSQLKEEYDPSSKSDFFVTSDKSNGITFKNYDINQSIRNEVGDVNKSDIQLRKCTEMDAATTVRKIIAHEEVSFKKYNELSLKLLLFDKALATYEENSIIKVILFVKDTLKPSEFNAELLKRPLAVQIYISFLKRMNYKDKLLDFYRLTNNTKEIAMLRLKETLLHETSQQNKIEDVQKCLSSHFRPNLMLYQESSFLQEYIKLLQLQIQIQKEDNEQSKKITLSILNRIPLKQPLFGRSLINTLQYCCLYHYNRPENQISSPQYLKKEFQISSKHFEWESLKSRCSLSYWNEIEKIFLSKNFFGMNQMKSTLGFEKVVSLLHKHKAPKEILTKYCELINDMDLRIEYAKICECNECLLMAYKQTRNKSAFDRLRINLKPNDSAYKLAMEIHNDQTIKWKT